MNNIFNIFSTREIALAIWFLVFLIFVSRTKNVRHSMIGVIKAFFDNILVFSTLLLYIVFVIFLLSLIGFWDISLLKDTILWFSFSGIVLLVNIYKAKNTNYFSQLIKDNIKIIAILEFLFNLYTLSFVWELMLIPTVFLFTVIVTFAEHSSKQDESHNNVVSLCKYILGFIGVVLIVYVICGIIIENKLLFSISNFKSFLLPILLLILTLPYFYSLALYMNYKSFIVVVKHLRRNEDPIIINSLIKATLKYANINLNTLKRIWKYQLFYNSSIENPDDFIKRVAKKPKYVISDKAKLTQFNDIQKVIKILSNIGIGKLDEWHKSYADDECYLSMTNYYQFGVDDITKIPNTIAFYLTGVETYIKQLEVVLDIGHEQDKNQTISKFIEILKQTFNSLEIPIPDDIANLLNRNRGFNLQNDTHTVSLNYEKFERIEKYAISIITKEN